MIGVSLDGPPKLHDYYRKNIQGEGSFHIIIKNIEMLKEQGVEFNILSVVNAKNAPVIKRTYEFYHKNGLYYLQFIPCLDPLGEVPGQHEYSLLPEVYGQFLIDLFNLWYIDLKQGRQPYIRHFENYIAILSGQPPESCDMRGICGQQYVVEADGSVYPCDFYVLDDYRLGNFNCHTVAEIDKTREKIGFIKASIAKDASCEVCRYAALCRSGCRRTRLPEDQHRQYFCQSYRMFFDACLPKLIEIARSLSSQTFG